MISCWLVLSYLFSFSLCVIFLLISIQIGNPEDWDKPHDPRKHFVEFFGTGEM